MEKEDHAIYYRVEIKRYRTVRGIGERKTVYKLKRRSCGCASCAAMEERFESDCVRNGWGIPKRHGQLLRISDSGEAYRIEQIEG